jgi:adenosylcobinamide-phosphate synthase
MPPHAKILLLALVLDAAIGDPSFLFARVSHPIALIGRAIGWLDRGWNREGDGDAQRRHAGMAVCLLLLVAALAVGCAFERLLAPLRFGWIIEAAVMSLLLAQNSLYRHVEAVARALASDGLAGGRRAVAKIVGRDPESLDHAGVCRAALESLAENFSDGVVAPAFWALSLGLPGMLAYKTINTADSMIGHRTPRHLAFGWAVARGDDLLNIIPARFAGLLLVASAYLVRGAKPARAFKAMMRDASQHRSPNAGWQEAALAGALGIALAGPRRYSGAVVDDHWMNSGGRQEANADDIRRGLQLYLVACALQLAVVGVIAVL